MIKAFNYRTPLVVLVLVEPADYRPLHAVELSSQIVLPSDLPLPPQTIILAYLILNTSLYRGPRVLTRATFGSGSWQSLQNGAGQVRNALVDSHPVVQFQVDWHFVFKAGLEIDPVSAPAIKASGWV